eukprot:6052667-Ditylum_brightwellii.AAC.1
MQPVTNVKPTCLATVFGEQQQAISFCSDLATWQAASNYIMQQDRADTIQAMFSGQSAEEIADLLYNVDFATDDSADQQQQQNTNSPPLSLLGKCFTTPQDDGFDAGVLLNSIRVELQHLA